MPAELKRRMEPANMLRKALIIGAPCTEGTEDYLPGVGIDIENFSNFFQSPLGGAWKASEITVLNNPPKSRVLSAVESLKLADYSVTVFCGHGFYSTTTYSNMIYINEKETIDSDILRNGAEKHTLLLDCCRVLQPSIAMEAFAKAIKTEGIRLDAAECRKYYDQRVTECAPGLSALIACSIGEGAGDSGETGGYYSSALLSAADTWWKASDTDTSRQFSVMSIVHAHDEAVKIVKKKSGNRQNPVIEKTRKEPYFPFAVIA